MLLFQDMHKGALVVLTNVASLQPRDYQEESSEDDISPLDTGFDIYQVAYILRTFNLRQIRVTLASVKGGEAPIDPKSIELAEQDSLAREFLSDRSLWSQFKQTKTLDDIRPEDYDAILFPGCRGTLIDWTRNTRLAEVASQIYYEQNGIIATIGHGASALISLMSAETREPFVRGLNITAFTDEEERGHGYYEIVPFSLERVLRDLGAKFEKSTPFKSHVVVSQDRLITGQNSQSVRDWIHCIVQQLERSA